MIQRLWRNARPTFHNAVAYTNAAAGSHRRPAVAGPAAVRKVVHETDRAAGIVVADHDYFDNLLNTLPDKYRALDRQGMYGDFFSFYLCDVVLKLNGKGGQPVYVKVAGQSYGTVRAEMKPFSERNPLVIGADRRSRRRRDRAGRAEVPEAAASSTRAGAYSAYFADAGGLTTGAAVRSPGFRWGRCPASNSTGRGVLVKFNVDKNVRLGDRTEAAIKTKSLLGTKFLDVTPAR